MNTPYPVVVCDPEDGTPREGTPIHLAVTGDGGEMLAGTCPVLVAAGSPFVHVEPLDMRTRSRCRRCLPDPVAAALGLSEKPSPGLDLSGASSD